MHAALSLSLLLVARAPAVQGDELARARALLESGEAERAAELLEDGLSAHASEAAWARALAQALERVVDAGGSRLALTDARDAWDRALALAPEDLETQRGAIGVRLRLGDDAAALALAERALGAAWLADCKAPAALLELACRARLGALPPRDAAPEERAAAVARVWTALAHARALAPESTELVRLSAELLEGEGLPQRAAAELVAALSRAPAASELHRALIDLHVQAGIEERLAPLYERWSAGGTNATLAWFSGYVWRLAGDVAQRERRFPDALAAYARAAQWLDVAATLEPSFRANAETVRFQARLSAGWCELESDALDAAAERLLALLRSEPARRDEPDGLGRSLMHALAALGEHRVAANDFTHASDEARAVVALLPAGGEWWNNLGFTLREYATQVAAGAIPGVGEREERSRALFRESWTAYRRAAELQPSDARVLNDAALVQVYHLRDSLGEAEALLGRAIERGEEQLAALGPAPEERARFPIAQALGDAYLNLGYLRYHVYRQSKGAREAFERALATNSGDRSDIAEYLAAIDGKRGPVDEPDRGAYVAAPEASEPARGWPAWEASLAEARARAAAEGRALVVYQRGDALGLAVPALDAFVTSPEFVRGTREAVLLLGDAERRTFVERRRDGRRVSCPRFGTVTCGEHARVEGELRTWFGEWLGHEPGEAEEGLWLLAPGAETPERLVDLARLADFAPAAAPVEASAPRPDEPFEALEASVGADDGGGAARALVGEHGLGARLAVERILFEGFRSGPARGALLGALAAEASAEARELFATCVRQEADPELELAALERWPAGFDLDAVVHAWRWAPLVEVRAAAERVLARERPGDAALRANAQLGAR